MNGIEVIFLTSSVLTGTMGLIILAINPWRTINQAYVIAASLSAIWLFCIFMAIHCGLRKETQWVLFWLKTINAIASFLPWSYSLVKTSITERRSLPHAIKRSWPWAFAGCLLVILVFSTPYIPGDPPRRGIGYPIHITALAVLCMLILSDAYKRMRACTGIHLLEMKFFVINICLSTLVILSLVATGTLFNIPQLRYAGPFVIIGSFGLTVSAICYHRVFDARQVFAVLGRRLSTLLVLASGIVVFNSYLSRIFIEPLSLLISACFGSILATYWDHIVFHWLDLDSKKILAAPRAKIIEWARAEADAGKLTLQFEAFLKDWCQAEAVTFHMLESHEPPSVVLKTSDYARDFPLLRQTGYLTPETLARRRPAQEIYTSKAVFLERNAAALIAIPRGSLTPSFVVIFGPKHSLRPYTYPDIQLLIELVELMDNILTQSRVAARTAQIEKMESAAMMSRGLAHDLNNLATPVSTFLLHMENRVKPGSAEAEVLADAKHSIRVMQDYIRESLFFARRLVPDFRPLSASDLLASTIKLTQTRAQARGIEIVLESAIDISFTADRALILRLLQNLVFNGIDATPRGGRVILSVAFADHDHVRFCVADHGSGVPAAIIDRIFEPYFTTKDTGDEIRGLGLGLAICLKISGLHGGDIHVGNTGSGGAIFTVCLPLAQKHSLDASSPQREFSPITTALTNRTALENPTT